MQPYMWFIIFGKSAVKFLKVLAGVAWSHL